MLARSLRFVATVLDLVTTNKELKAVWLERQPKILVLVRDLVAARLGELLFALVVSALTRGLVCRSRDSDTGFRAHVDVSRARAVYRAGPAEVVDRAGYSADGEYSFFFFSWFV